MRNPIRFAPFAVALALLAAGCGGASDEAGGGGEATAASGGGTELALVAYSTPEVVYDELIPAFAKTEAGGGVTVKTSFGASGDQSRAVEAGAAVTVNANGVIADATPDDVAMAVGWTDDQFVVVDRPLREVVPLMNRWYRLDLNVAEERLLDRKATVRAPIGSSRQAIEQVEATANVKFGYDGDNKVLRDAAAAPPSRRR